MQILPGDMMILRWRFSFDLELVISVDGAHYSYFVMHDEDFKLHYFLCDSTQSFVDEARCTITTLRPGANSTVEVIEWQHEG